MPVRPEKAVLLVQKEVAQKIAATAPDSSYMSVFVQTFYDVIYLETVPRTKFDPAPKVDGGIIKMVHREDPGISAEMVQKYEGFLHKGFSNPRKMLNKVFTKEELQKIGVEANLRPQNLDASQWLEAFKLLNF
jgi:16S rRNA (adenine1518-N6/adenine1519-N6)-dimethyltransferase